MVVLTTSLMTTLMETTTRRKSASAVRKKRRGAENTKAAVTLTTTSQNATLVDTVAVKSSLNTDSRKHKPTAVVNRSMEDSRSMGVVKNIPITLLKN